MFNASKSYILSLVMPLFRKVIVRPGVFSTKNPKTGKRTIKAVTKDYLKSVCETANEMIKDGIRIPGPYAHKDEKGIVPNVVFTKDGVEVDGETSTPPIWNSAINAGFWQRFEQDAKGQLVGFVDLPGDVKDLNTPSGKVRNTIKETSVFVEPEFTDGLGKVRKNALRHVALVTGAVEPNQEDFELVDTDNQYALAMSFSMSDEVSGATVDEPEKTPSGPETESNTDTEPTSKEDETSCAANISEIVSLIKDKLGYEMPSDTTDKNFIDRLRTILVSIQSDSNPEENEDLTKKPEKAETESSPVIMSTETENKDNLVVLQNKASKMLEAFMKVFKEDLTSRVNKLIAKGVIGRAQADKILTPQVEALAMSLDDFDVETCTFAKSPLEMSIEILEGNTGLLDNVAETKPNGAVTEQHLDEQDQMTEDEAEAVYNSVL